MYQMTRRIVSNDSIRQPVGCTNANFDQKLRHVPDSCAEVDRPFCEIGIISEQLAIFFHCRAATGGIHDYSVRAAPGKSLNVPPRKLTSGFKLPRMSVKRTTTYLSARLSQLTTVASQHTLGRAVRIAKQTVHYAAGQDRNAHCFSIMHVLSAAATSGASKMGAA